MREDGILFIDKPVGVTSRKVDNQIGKLFHTRSVGHLGTLDPFASGLLILGVNKGNKWLPFLGDSVKTYMARICLGKKTSTGDPTGEFIQEAPIPALEMNKIKAVLQGFLGKSLQIPPMTSAIKVDGEALYKKAHKGEEIERKPREIEVFSLNAIYYEAPYLDITCTVSSGTYIRTLGEDIAVALGTVGYLTDLRRLSIGKHMIDLAKPLDEITVDDLLEPSFYVRDIKHVEVSEDKLKRIKNGMTIREQIDYGPRILYTNNGIGISVYEKRDDGYYHCLRGLF